MRKSSELASYVAALFCGIIGLLIWLGLEFELYSYRLTVVFLTIVMVGFLVLEMLRIRRIQPRLWLINPVVLCSIVTFVLSFGITNIVYFLPEDTLVQLGLVPEVTPWMSKTMGLVLLGAISMLLGYWTSFAARLSRHLASSLFAANIFRKDWSFRTTVMVAMVLTSLAARLLAIKLEIYGFSGDKVQALYAAGYSQYLGLGFALGKVALVVASLRYFSLSGRSPEMALWFWGLLGYEVFFGFISGFKSQVAMPMVIVGICYYMRQGRIPWRFVALVPVALMLAYTVIEPFRATKNQDVSFSGTSLSAIMMALNQAVMDQSATTIASEDQAGIAEKVMARTNLLQMAAQGVEYSDTVTIPEDAPNFLLDIFLAPVYAFLPRILFDFKAEATQGIWYYNVVLGREGGVSIAMSTVTYLYLAGGGLAVALGFFVLGIIHRVVNDVLLNAGRSGADFVFLIVLTSLVWVDSAYYSMIVSLIRFLLLGAILQRLIYRR